MITKDRFNFKDFILEITKIKINKLINNESKLMDGLSDFELSRHT